jgi:hypothetical protein
VKISHRRHLMMATALAAGLVVAVPLSTRLAYAGPGTSASDPGFTPDTGQINPGFDKKNPSSSEARKIPTPAEARAAKMLPISSQPSPGSDPTVQQPGPTPAATGDQPDTRQQQSPNAAGAQATQSRAQSGTAPAATTGSGNASNASTQVSDGPIGSTGQTIPAKFSERNDTLDRVPTMAQPIPLTDQERQRIYQAVMADKTQAAAGAEALGPASYLSTDQALNEIHPLPASVQNIAAVKGLQYVKAKDKVLLVEPATRIVFEQIVS